MKLLYKPFAIIGGIIAARLGRRVFKGVWAKIDDREPPTATTASASLTKVVGASALEAATMAGVATAVDRAGARSFHYLTGYWPGEKEPKPTSPKPEPATPEPEPAHPEPEPAHPEPED